MCDTIACIIGKIKVGILQPLITMLFALATVIFLWGVVNYVIGSKGNSTKLEEGRRIMIWGIVGMFIMSSAWGIVQLLCNFFQSCT